MTITPEMIQNKMNLTMSQVAKQLGVTNLTTFKTTFGALDPRGRCAPLGLPSCIGAFFGQNTPTSNFEKITPRRSSMRFFYVYLLKYMQFIKKLI